MHRAIPPRMAAQHSLQQVHARASPQEDDGSKLQIQEVNTHRTPSILLRPTISQEPDAATMSGLSRQFRATSGLQKLTLQVVFQRMDPDSITFFGFLTACVRDIKVISTINVVHQIPKI
jgi:hypothetical protein